MSTIAIVVGYSASALLPVILYFSSKCVVAACVEGGQARIHDHLHRRMDVLCNYIHRWIMHYCHLYASLNGGGASTSLLGVVGCLFSG